MSKNCKTIDLCGAQVNNDRLALMTQPCCLGAVTLGFKARTGAKSAVFVGRVITDDPDVGCGLCLPWRPGGLSHTPERETITRINADPIHRRIYTALGGNKITKSGRYFHWGLVHPVQSASLCWNSHNIFHTVFETLPVSAKSLPILPPDYWHPSQSNFTEYKQDVVAVLYAPVNGQWVH